MPTKHKGWMTERPHYCSLFSGKRAQKRWSRSVGKDQVPLIFEGGQAAWPRRSVVTCHKPQQHHALQSHFPVYQGEDAGQVAGNRNRFLPGGKGLTDRFGHNQRKWIRLLLGRHRFQETPITAKIQPKPAFRVRNRRNNAAAQIAQSEQILQWLGKCKEALGLQNRPPPRKPLEDSISSSEVHFRCNARTTA